MDHGGFLLKYIGESPIKLVKFRAAYLGERKIPLDRLNSKRKYRNGLYTVKQITSETRRGKR